jgi:hypothetical protein
VPLRFDDQKRQAAGATTNLVERCVTLLSEKMQPRDLFMSNNERSEIILEACLTNKMRAIWSRHCGSVSRERVFNLDTAR